MELSKLIVDVTPREEAGNRTTKRYDYQKDLSIFLLIAKHPGSSDYVFIFDHHDDLLIIDSEHSPTSLDVYQIKSKATGHWNLSAFVNKEKPDSLSILGKLYHNKAVFETYVKKLNIISNAPFAFDLADEGKGILKSTIAFSDLPTSDRQTITELLKKEHSLTQDPELTDLLYFLKSDLSLQDSATHCAGALSKLFHNINPAYNANIELAYQQIFNEVKIRSAATVSQDSGVDWTLLKQKKGITRAQFVEIINVAGVYKSLESTWAEIDRELNSNGVPFLQRRTLRAAWRTANATILSQPNNIPLRQIITKVKQIVVEQRSEPALHHRNLSELISNAYDRCGDLGDQPFARDFIEALILREIYND